jgi:hypothetical protein
MLGVREKGVDGGGGEELTVVSSVCKVDVYAAPQVICWRGDVRSRRVRPAKHRRLMLHDFPALFGPRAQEEHCT